MDLGAAIAWLERFSGVRSPFGLHRVEQLLTILDHPERQYPSVLIAGTNGKGSVAAMVEAVVQATGDYHSGATISPHLLAVPERVRLGGRTIDPGLFCRGVEALQEPVGVLCGPGGAGEPSFFELVTVLAMWAFREEDIDLAVVECGLGGRLDATNVLFPEVAVITNIGTDHREYLGDSRAQIAEEKLAIVKKKGELVTGETDAGLLARFGERCRELKGTLFPAALPDWLTVLASDARGHRLSVAGAGEVTLTLPGRHQLQNLAVALAAIERLRTHHFDLAPAAVQAGLGQVRWPGRLQWLAGPGGLPLLLDGAHNAEGVDALNTYLREFPMPRPLHLVLGALRGKPAAAMARTLAAHADTLAFVPPPTPRALTREQFGEEIALADRRWRWHDDLAGALQPPPGTAAMLVTGSLYLVAQALRRHGDGA